MEALTKEEQELIADLHKLRRVDYVRYSNLLDAFDTMIKYEAENPPNRRGQPQPGKKPDKIIPFPSSQQISR